MTDRRRYRRILPDDPYPTDVVYVAIGWEPDLQPLIEPVGEVMLPDPYTDRETGTYDVPMALFIADKLMIRHGLREVLISIHDRSHWRPDWGDLVED